jgi:hypothetical protein
MRVHLRNVVESAVERGVVMGHHRVSKLPRQKQKDPDVVVDTFLKSIWESLDGIIDFTDDGLEHDDEDKPSPRITGFQADAIADTILPSDEEYEDEEEDATIPLNVLHRIHRHAHPEKPTKG